jgi:hypothetical protein
VALLARVAAPGAARIRSIAFGRVAVAVRLGFLVAVGVTEGRRVAVRLGFDVAEGTPANVAVRGGAGDTIQRATLRGAAVAVAGTAASLTALSRVTCIVRSNATQSVSPSAPTKAIDARK